MNSSEDILRWLAKELLPGTVAHAEDTLRDALDDDSHPNKANYGCGDLVRAWIPMACFRHGMTGPRVVALNHLLYRWSLLPPGVRGVIGDKQITTLDRLNGYALFGFEEPNPHRLQVLVQMRLQALAPTACDMVDAETIARVVKGKWLGNQMPERFERVTLGPGRPTGHELLISRSGGMTQAAHAAQPWPRRAIMTSDAKAFENGSNPVLEVKGLNRSTFLLAQHARAMHHGRMIAVTGSSGKTSAKEMIAQLLGEQWLTRKTGGSANSFYACAATLINSPLATQASVFECGLGVTGSGLDAMSGMIQPDIAVVTSVSAAHLGGYASVLEIARRKLDIARHLTPNGQLIVDGDNPILEEALREMPEVDSVCVVRVGMAAHCPVRVVDVAVTEAGTTVQVNMLGVRHQVTLPLYGAHWGKMAAMALLCCQLVGADVRRATDTLSKLVFDHKGRGELHKIRVEGGVLRVFDSHYNANPGSMRAELDAFQAVAQSITNTSVHLRRVALIGAMAELGEENSPAIHQDLVAWLLDAGFDRLLLVGQDEFASCLDTLHNSGRPFEIFSSTPEALAALVSEVRPDRFLFVKGSNKWDLCQVVPHLQQLPAAQITA